jgi:hypothetical protein
MNRTEIINYLIEQNGYKTYLEIGIDNPANNFNLIKCQDKTGVDPYDKKLRVATHWNDDNKEMYSQQIQYVMTSDNFFKQNEKKFDIVFIDGLHLDWQVKRDIKNSLNFLNDGGVILLHDCLPERYEGQLEQDIGYGWWGTVWREFARLRISNPELSMYTINTDCGIGVIKKGGQELFDIGNKFLDWDLFLMYKNTLMNILEVNQFVEKEKNI